MLKSLLVLELSFDRTGEEVCCELTELSCHSGCLCCVCDRNTTSQWSRRPTEGTSLCPMTASHNYVLVTFRSLRRLSFVIVKRLQQGKRALSKASLLLALSSSSLSLLSLCCHITEVGRHGLSAGHNDTGGGVVRI